VCTASASTCCDVDTSPGACLHTKRIQGQCYCQQQGIKLCVGRYGSWPGILQNGAMLMCSKSRQQQHQQRRQRQPSACSWEAQQCLGDRAYTAACWGWEDREVRLRLLHSRAATSMRLAAPKPWRAGDQARGFRSCGCLGCCNSCVTEQTSLLYFCFSTVNPFKKCILSKVRQ